MARSRDISKVLSSNSTLATDAEVAASYLTQTSASTTYSTKTTQGLVLLRSETFTGVSTINFDNVFTDDYLNYKVVISTRSYASTGPTEVWFRLRSGGTAATSSYYGSIFKMLYGGSTSISGYSNYGAGILYTNTGDLETFSVIEIGYPKLDERTLVTAHTQVSSNQVYNLSGFQHGGTTPYDGFGLTCSLHSFGDSQISIYGYKK